MAKIGKILLPPAILVAGLAAGGGTAYATAQFLGLHFDKKVADNVPTKFVSTGPVLAPLVFPDGRLSGYVSFHVELEVPVESEKDVTERMPLLLDAINMRTYKTPMAAGPDGMLPKLDTFRKVTEEAARQAFGADVVRKVAVTNASPA